MTTKTMMKIHKALGIAIITIGILLVAFTIVVSATGCSQADVAAENVSKDAENFKVMRRVVFFNGITDKYLLEIVGKCSIETPGNRQMFVIVKVGPDQFKKHYLGLSDNVSYFVEQLEPVSESVYFYKVNFRPTTIIPNININ